MEDNVLIPQESAAETVMPPAERFGPEEMRKANQTLRDYKAGKANLEHRLVEDELWWEGRHWEAIRRVQPRTILLDHKGEPIKRADTIQPQPTSAWLFNAILNKHADAMDNSPEPVVLAREASDKESAKTIQEILPVVMEQNNYEQVYSDQWWEKLKHGAACYMITWDKDKENGLGDVSIKGLDLLNLFWEPGVTDIQDSRNLFITELVDRDILEEEYPELEGRIEGNTFDVKQYIYDDTVDISHKVVVVDMYYKIKSETGKTILHYAKFVNEKLIYASENDPNYADRGFYDHGLYPVVIDTLFPEKGTPIGFGYVSLCRDPQLYIDKISANILENAMMTTKKRFFVSDSTNINMEEFLDWTEPLVHVSGEISDARVKEIITQPVSAVYPNIMQLKIDEMKETVANRDINSGSSGSGVTSGAAISALQEAGNKASRDMINATYRSQRMIYRIVLELFRQFYDIQRSFRIEAPNGMDYDFVDFSNREIVDQETGVNVYGEMLYRHPVFDLKVVAQKKNPFSRMEQNERAKELYSMGFFNPDNAQSALMCLNMMDFEGIDEVRSQIAQGMTLNNLCQQLMMQNQMLKAQLGMPADPMMDQDGAPAAAMPGAAPETNEAAGDPMKSSTTPDTRYQSLLKKRAVPSVGE